MKIKDAQLRKYHKKISKEIKKWPSWKRSIDYGGRA